MHFDKVDINQKAFQSVHDFFRGLGTHYCRFYFTFAHSLYMMAVSSEDQGKDQENL